MLDSAALEVLLQRLVLVLFAGRADVEQSLVTVLMETSPSRLAAQAVAFGEQADDLDAARKESLLGEHTDPLAPIKHENRIAV